MLIDSHCHLERAFRHGELDEVLSRAEEMGVVEMITVGTSLKDWALYQQISSKYPGKLHWTAGIHPCDVDEDWEDQIKLLPSFFATDPLPVALGEIGLDHFHLPKFPDEILEVKSMQLRAFKAQLNLAYQFDCPVVIHSRNAFSECVAAIDESGVDWRKVVFHCFVEGPEEMRILNERGGRGSFTGIVTYKNSSADCVRQALLAQGPDSVMLETDSPYLTPEPMRGKPNEPGYVSHIARFCADLFDWDFDEFARLTSSNTRTFFGLNG